MKQLLRRAENVSTRAKTRGRTLLGFAAAAAVLALVGGTTAAWASDYNRDGGRGSSASAKAAAGTNSSGVSAARGKVTHKKKSTATPTPTPTPTPTSAPVAAPAPAPARTPARVAAPAPVTAATGTAPLHTNVVATSFWVGEIFDASLPDGSQMISTYDGGWFASYGGCDGVSSGGGCATEARTAANGFFPTQMTPKENPFYLDLPFDDVNDSIAFKQRCQVIPWAGADNAATGVNNCANSNYSYMKNSWVQLTGPNGNTCYGQVQDAGPSSGSLYHDANYVFGSADARPANTKFSGDSGQGAGADVSPALNGCLGFADLNGDNDRVSWRFVDRASVPAGPWLKVVTTSQVSG